MRLLRTSTLCCTRRHTVGIREATGKKKQLFSVVAKPTQTEHEMRSAAAKVIDMLEAGLPAYLGKSSLNEALQLEV